MKLSLTTNDGELLEQWEIEVDFGDIRKPFPASTMTNDIISVYKRQRKKEEQADDECRGKVSEG